jgi:zinc transport system substrate-binding protein
MRRLFLILLLSIIISPSVFSGGASESGANESGINESGTHQLMVYVSIPPQAYLVERIGGGNVSVGVLVKPGKDPHTFDPSPKEMVALAQSAIYFTIGFPFEEQLLAKIEKSNPQLSIITSDKGVKRRKPDVPGDHHSDQGADEEHSDPHIWLSVRNSMIIAANIHNALAEADPGNANEYKMNLELLLQDLGTLDNKISTLLQPLQGRDFFVFHPSFGYFADDYGLSQVAVEIEGKSPTPKQIEYLIAQAQAAAVKIIFVQPQFDSRSASVIADSIQGTVIFLDPLAYDLIENFEDMAVKIEKALTR